MSFFLPLFPLLCAAQASLRYIGRMIRARTISEASIDSAATPCRDRASRSAGGVSSAPCRQREEGLLSLPVASAIFASVPPVVFFAAATSVSAAGAEPPPVSWTQYGGILLAGGVFAAAALINLVLSIWSHLKPRPPFRDQFAALGHEHPAYLTRADHEQMCDGRSVTDARSMARVEQTLSDMQQAMLDMDRKAESRAAKLHGRVDDMAKPLNQMIGRYEAHMDWHKSKGGDQQ
jgi:hypothetical protein